RASLTLRRRRLRMSCREFRPPGFGHDIDRHAQGTRPVLPPRSQPDLCQQTTFNGADAAPLWERLGQIAGTMGGAAAAHPVPRPTGENERQLGCGGTAFALRERRQQGAPV
ncbi:MAG TPA: hypothetical protein PKA88_32715, partial [Polyangiaceae bacterium]|nr:hypothetical protein [Polyangiaceae bacterium]